MKARSDAMRRRWADPAYRERQIEVLRRANEKRQEQLADPLERKRVALVRRQSMSKRKKLV